MALYNSAYAVVLPFIFLFTLPIAFFASLTTFLAFSVLLIRVIFVYIELALAVIPYYLFGVPSSKYPPPYPSSSSASAYETAIRSAPPRRRRRRTSSSSNLSGGTGGSITPVPGENLWALSQSIGPTRDFEGVGGWRLDADLADDDALWTNINTRLELPADHGRRHHHRSLTSGSVPGDAVRYNKRSISPPEPVVASNISKVRTSPTTSSNGVVDVVANGTGLGPAAANTSKGLKRNNSGAVGSSGSSKGSSMLSMKQR